MEYKTVNTGGKFIRWAEHGQQIELRVVAFDPVGATDLQDRPIPRLDGITIAPATNHAPVKDGGGPVDLATGSAVVVTGGYASLRRGLILADPKPGDHMRITYVGDYDSGRPQPGKDFRIEHAPASPATAQAQLTEDDL